MRHTRKLPAYAVTMNGISAWYKDVFERVGWMVLAKAKGFKDKIATYKNSIRRLLVSIDHLKYESVNRTQDLKVLRMNVEELWAFVQKNL